MMNNLTYQQSETNSQKVPFPILVLLFCMVFDEVLSWSFYSAEDDRTIVYAFRFVLSLAYSIYILFLNNCFTRRLLPLEKMIYLFILWTFFSMAIVTPGNILALRELSRFIYWGFAFPFVYLVVLRYPRAIQYICFFFALSAVFFLFVTISGREAMIDRRSSRGASGINSSYCLVFAYPWLLMYRSKWIKYLGLLIVCGGVIISYKRGAVLTLFMAICMTGLSGFLFYQGKQRLYWVIKCIFIVIIASLFIIYLFRNLYHLKAGYEYRMDAEQGSFSGRREIWEHLYYRFSTSSYFNYICGNGLLTTVKETGLRAHNDWFEILYCLGIIGLVIFILCNCHIFVVLYQLFKRKMELFIPCVAGYVVFFFKSVSGGWTHYTSFAYFLSLIAVACAMYERDCLAGLTDEQVTRQHTEVEISTGQVRERP